MKKFKEIIFVFCAGFFVYSFSLGNQFLWDDEKQIVENTVIQNIRNLPLILKSGIFYTPGRELGGGFFRPLVSLAYMLLYLAGKGSPLPFRLFQVFLHSVNSVLVYCLFLKLLPSKKISFFLGLIFAVHPAVSEAVLFISGIGEPLYFFFSLVSFLFFLSYRFSFLSFIFFFLALLTKEAAAVLFLIIIVFSLLFPSKKKSLTIISLGYFWTMLIYIFLRFLAIGGFASQLKFPSLITQQSLFVRILTIPYSILFYILTFFFPLNLAISNQKVVASIMEKDFWLAALFVLLIFLIVFRFYTKTKSPLLVFFALWFLIGLLPVLNFIPLSSTVAERWLYFPAVGILGILGVLATNLSLHLKGGRRLVLFLTVFLIVLLAGRTVWRTFDWKNGYLLYKHDLSFNPDSFELQNNYGVELFRRGEIDKAKIWFQKSVESNGRWWPNFNNLAAVYEREGNYQKAEELYQKSIDNGDYSLAYENLAHLYLKMKNYQKADFLLKKATDYFPYHTGFHRLYAITLYKTGKTEVALKEAQILFKLAPSLENYHLLQKIANKQELD